ncbi:MAG: YwmB family TATA-box binding protein [Bacillota bacterium]|nr:YwmB family TATA-box binding protein [Bacillota bacterium]
MKKVYYVILFLTLSIMVVSSIYYKVIQRPEESEILLTKAFKSSGADIVKSEINFWGKLNVHLKNVNNMKQLADNLTGNLNVKKDNTYSSNIIDNNQLLELKVNCKTVDGKLVAIYIQSLKAADQGKDEVSVTVTKDLGYNDLIQIRRDVEKAFKKYDIVPKVNSCITGSINRKLNQKEIEDLCSLTIKKIEAIKVEGIKDEKLESISAYSPLINDSVTVNGKRINLNLAIRYNTNENKTYIWLATPVITIEY